MLAIEPKPTILQCYIATSLQSSPPQHRSTINSTINSTNNTNTNIKHQHQHEQHQCPPKILYTLHYRQIQGNDDPFRFLGLFGAIPNTTTPLQQTPYTFQSPQPSSHQVPKPPSPILHPQSSPIIHSSNEITPPLRYHNGSLVSL